jgi:hypothetical protein
MTKTEIATAACGDLAMTIPLLFREFEFWSFEFVPPFGDSRKYNQIKDLSIYGIGFRI